MEKWGNTKQREREKRTKKIHRQGKKEKDGKIGKH